MIYYIENMYLWSPGVLLLMSRNECSESQPFDAFCAVPGFGGVCTAMQPRESPLSTLPHPSSPSALQFYLQGAAPALNIPLGRDSGGKR